jgi:hypothetical protein
VIYLACPYSHPNPFVRRSRVEIATRVAATLMLRGHVVYSPLTAQQELYKYLPDKELDWDFWRLHDFAYIAKSDILMVLQLMGWKESTGISEQIKYARSIGLYVKFISREAVIRLCSKG